MSHVTHDVLVVTCFRDDDMDPIEARARAIWGESQLLVGPILSDVNGYRTLLILPCGSKCGWPEWEEHEGRLKQMVAALEEAEKAGQWSEWCWVRYGNDDARASVKDSAWSPKEDLGANRESGR